MMIYKKLPKDSEIDPEVALLQGASALDAAGEKAELLNDVEGLLNVAAMWMKFSEQIQEFASKVEEATQKAIEAEEIVKSKQSKIEMGFCIPTDEPEIIADEGEEID